MRRGMWRASSAFTLQQRHMTASAVRHKEQGGEPADRCEYCACDDNDLPPSPALQARANLSPLRSLRWALLLRTSFGASRVCRAPMPDAGLAPMSAQGRSARSTCVNRAL